VGPKARWILACAAVATVAFAAFLPTLKSEFLSWDDSRYVTQNPWIRSWSSENLRHIFTKPYFVSYMPLQLVSYIVDYSFWGLKPFGYHLQQIVLHALDSALVVVVGLRLFGRFRLAAIAGLLFAVHPSHVESVAWISARKDVLSAAFLLPSVCFYLRARGERSLRRGPYVASLVFFSLAVLSKVNVVVMPLFLILVDMVSPTRGRRTGKPWLQALGGKIPYGVIGLGVAIVNWVVEVKTKAAYARDPVRYLVLKGHAAWNYLGTLTGIPRQNPIYDTPQVALDILSIAVHLGGLLLLPFLVWLGHRHRDRVLALGAGWTLVMLLPAILFPVPTYVADRYLYMPSLGFCWLAAGGILAVSAKLKTPAARAATAALLTAIPTGFFAARTVQYSRAWATSEALWSYTIQRSNDFRAYNNLARVRIDQERWDEAERLFKLGSRQANVTSYDGLAVVYYKTGRYAEALQANDKAFEMHALKGDDPVEFADLQYKRGSIYLAQSRTAKAIEAYETALRANPHHPDARRMLDLARQAESAAR
jgi:hypothetical protein